MPARGYRHRVVWLWHMQIRNHDTALFRQRTSLLQCRPLCNALCYIALAFLKGAQDKGVAKGIMIIRSQLGCQGATSWFHRQLGFDFAFMSAYRFDGGTLSDQCNIGFTFVEHLNMNCWIVGLSLSVKNVHKNRKLTEPQLATSECFWHAQLTYVKSLACGKCNGWGCLRPAGKEKLWLTWIACQMFLYTYSTTQRIF